MSTMPAARTWATSDLANGTLLNTYIRDSFLATIGKLDSTVFTSSQASITFSSISQTYQHLLIVGGYTSDTLNGPINGAINFNGDVTTTYHTHLLTSTGTFSSGIDQSGSTFGYGIQVGGKLDVKNGSVGLIIIPNYRSTNYKSWVGGSFGFGSSAAGANNVSMVGGMWKSTATITSIVTVPNAAGGFLHGGMTLYGLT